MRQHLPLNALRAFQTVARMGSLSGAAAELAVSPSAVSHQIRKLEEYVGLPLLVREGRGIRLTEDAKELQRGLSDAFIQISDAVDRVCQPVRGKRLHVSATPNFASAWLIPRVERFKEQFPKIDLILDDSTERTPVSRRNEVVIDWGDFKALPQVTETMVRLSQREEMFPVCSPYACPGPGLANATLLEHRDIGTPWNWLSWRDFFAATGVSSKGAMYGTAMTPRLLLDAARHGKGVILANTTMACDDLATGRLVRPILESLTVEESYWLLVHRSAFARPEVRDFVIWLKTEFDAFVESGP